MDTGEASFGKAKGAVQVQKLESMLEIAREISDETMVQELQAKIKKAKESAVKEKSVRQRYSQAS
eukprot:1093638-Alexandrium_andersonii.AAC.1